MTITMDKQYRTRNGQKVVLYTTTAKNKRFPVHGVVLGYDDAVEWPSRWESSGACDSRFLNCDLDLIEVPKTHEITRYLYLQSDGSSKVTFRITEGEFAE